MNNFHHIRQPYLARLDPMTCLHSLRLPIQVPLIPPLLCSSEDLTFTIKQSTPFPINSWPVPYHSMVPYPHRLSDIICCSPSIQVCFWSASPCLVLCSVPLPSLLCSFSLSDPWPHHLIDFPLGLFPWLLSGPLLPYNLNWATLYDSGVHH